MRFTFLKKSFFVLVLFTSFSVFSQIDVNQLYGKWDFESMITEKEMDSVGLAMMEVMFTKATFQFSKEGLYKSTLIVVDSGSWTYTGKGNTISLHSNRGNVDELIILMLDEETLQIGMGKKAKFELKRLGASDELVKAVPAFEFVTATEAEVAKKWFFLRQVKADNNGLSDELVDAMQVLLKGNYLDFKANGSYVNYNRIADVKEKGTWEFNEDRKSIVVSVESTKKIFNILSISDSELELVEGNSKDKWVLGLENPKKKEK